jgi:2-oxoglutarate dehydrogenase E2 component (dihydrolipoamide succinyltransferase)
VKDVDGQDVLAILPMCYVSLTIDHRVLDGYQTNAFLSELVAKLENWPG